ncbi:MAG: mandelate racemase/muconate lactonizing enzyme family protein [Chloroflexi bacterium]|nr:mandelate racemase/muconate lactonizing enzyme family protein [Chloroflexota bacterium]
MVKVDTDEGISGWGTAGTRWELADAARKVLTPHFIGEDALQPDAVTERAHQWTFWYGRGGTITNFVGAMNQALWDIFGKSTGQSVSRLFGGRFTDTIKPYASMLFEWPVDQMIRQLEAGMELNFRAFKMGWGTFGRVDANRDRELVSAARKAVGDDVEIMVDAGGSDIYWHNGLKWAMETARMLADYNVKWFEEPLRADDLEGYKALTASSPVPISGGEVLTRRQAFEPWIRERAVDILQPDQTICGGLSETRRIWQMAYDNNVQVITHGWNTAVGLAADLQLAASMPDSKYVEFWYPAPYVDGILVDPFMLNADGLLDIPDKPGLGIELDEDAIKERGKGADDYGL